MTGITKLGMLALALTQGVTLPTQVRGTWKVGQPYDLPRTPVGLDNKQVKSIVGSVLSLSETQLDVCGKAIPIQKVSVKHFTQDEFAERYGFAPRQIGLQADTVFEITIDGPFSMGACGDFNNPGTDLLVGGTHVVTEVANAYFPLRKQNAN